MTRHAHPVLTDYTIEQAKRNDGGDRPERIPEQQVCVLKHAKTLHQRMLN
jgi:hypothetical protein